MVKAEGPTDLELAREMVGTLGVQAAARLVLFCLYWRARGRRSFAEVAHYEEERGPSEAARWRAYRDLRKLRDRFAELEGRRVELDEVAEWLASGGGLGQGLGVTHS